MRAQQGRSRLPGRHWWQGDTAIARPQRRPIDPQFDGRHAGVSARISRPPAAGTPAPRPSCLPAAWLSPPMDSLVLLGLLNKLRQTHQGSTMASAAAAAAVAALGRVAAAAAPPGPQSSSIGSWHARQPGVSTSIGSLHAAAEELVRKVPGDGNGGGGGGIWPFKSAKADEERQLVG